MNEGETKRSSIGWFIPQMAPMAVAGLNQGKKQELLLSFSSGCIGPRTQVSFATFPEMLTGSLIGSKVVGT